MTFKKINENEQQNLHDRSCMILVNFNAKELAAMLENGKKLLIRFLKSKKMKFTIEKFVRDTNALGAIMNTKKTMYNNIPTTIFAPMLNRVSNQGEFDMVMGTKTEFITYYIEHMERQE